MMYSTTVQNFRMKHVILEATQKWQILTNVEGFKNMYYSRFQIHEFVKFTLPKILSLSYCFFFTVIEYIIVPNFLKLQNAIF
jgi:hypothetical protein